MLRPKSHQRAACSCISDENAKQRECWQGQFCYSCRPYSTATSSNIAFKVGQNTKLVAEIEVVHYIG